MIIYSKHYLDKPIYKMKNPGKNGIGKLFQKLQKLT